MGLIWAQTQLKLWMSSSDLMELNNKYSQLNGTLAQSQLQWKTGGTS